MQTLELNRQQNQQSANHSQAYEQIHFQNLSELAMSYMPFITHGGLFISTHKQFSLGQKIMIHLNLPGFCESQPYSATVIWITPITAQGQRLPGIGVQFEATSSIKDTIESMLSETKTPISTHTV